MSTQQLEQEELIQKSVTIQLPESVVNRLDDMARQLLLSRSAVIRLGVQEYLNELEQRRKVA